MNKIRQIVAYLRHFLTAWNTTGEAIHSPYLFRLVRFDMRDRNPFYCFANIERQRDLLLVCDDTLDVVDYGSAGSPKGLHVQRRVCDIAKNHLESPKMAQLLFRILHFMHEEEKRPLEILELGTSFGITTAYLASADSRDRVTTLEGSGAVLRIAQGIWRNLKLENIEWYEGNVDDTLYNIYEEKSLIANRKSLIDFAYIDANHTYEATLRYTDYLLPRMTEKGIIAIDDIHYSQDMERAWKKLQQNPRVTTSMDLYHMGLLFVDKHYLKRHYRIRI